MRIVFVPSAPNLGGPPHILLIVTVPSRPEPR